MNKRIAIGKKVTTTLTLLIVSCSLTSAVAQTKKGHKHKHAHKEVALGKFKIDGIEIMYTMRDVDDNHVLSRLRKHPGEAHHQCLYQCR